MIKSINKAKNRKKFENNSYIICKYENEIFSPYRINYQGNAEIIEKEWKPGEDLK